MQYIYTYMYLKPTYMDMLKKDVGSEITGFSIHQFKLNLLLITPSQVLLAAPVQPDDISREQQWLNLTEGNWRQNARSTQLK